MSQKSFTTLITAACIAVSIGISGTAAAASKVSLEADYWKPGVSGELKAANTDVKFNDDLGFGKKGLSGYTLNFKQGDNQKFFLRYEGATFKADSTLPRAFSFAGGNYAKGDNVNSELKTSHYQIGLRNEKITSGGKVSTIYSYTHGKVETRMQDVTRNFSRTKEDKINSFGIGFGWESVNAKGVNFFAEVMPLSISSKGNGFYDYIFGVKTKLGRKLGLTIGYKGENLGSYNSDDTKVELKGIYLYLGSNF